MFNDLVLVLIENNIVCTDLTLQGRFDLDNNSSIKILSLELSDLIVMLDDLGDDDVGPIATIIITIGTVFIVLFIYSLVDVFRDVKMGFFGDDDDDDDEKKNGRKGKGGGNPPPAPMFQ